MEEIKGKRKLIKIENGIDKKGEGFVKE